MGSLTVSNLSSGKTSGRTLLEAPSGTARRLQAEWSLLTELAALNPRRLTGLTADDATLRLTLRQTPARTLTGGQVDEHWLRLEYPRFFPALPLELYLEAPVFHPNVHPETGFVCLWDRHRSAHTVQDALHKTASILGWRLFNLRPEHTMQPDAARLLPEQRAELQRQLDTAPLLGVRGFQIDPPATAAEPRRRLS